LRVVGAKIVDEVCPGSEKTYPINVGNTTISPMSIAIEVKGYGTSDDGTLRVLEPEDDKDPNSAREFLTVFPTRFHLEPGQTRDVTVTSRIPGDVVIGERKAVIFIHTVLHPGGRFGVITAIAVKVLLTIKAPEIE